MHSINYLLQVLVVIVKVVAYYEEKKQNYNQNNSIYTRIVDKMTYIYHNMILENLKNIFKIILIN
jgi:hypothetical protein